MRYAVLSTLLIITQLPALAQATEADHQGTLGGGIGVSSPTGDFDRAWGRDMFLIGAQLAYPMRRVPILQVGFSFGYSVMGRNSTEVPINTNYQNISTGELTTRSKVFGYHPLLRLAPLTGKVRPYADGMVGFRQFSTVSKVTAKGTEGNVSKERNEGDLAFSRGWAAGVQVMLGTRAYAEVRVERFNSGEATYVDPSSVSVSDQGEVSFNTLTSNTDVTNVLFGVGFRF
jgi:hypothetical protein